MEIVHIIIKLTLLTFALLLGGWYFMALFGMNSKLKSQNPIDLIFPWVLSRDNEFTDGGAWRRSYLKVLLYSLIWLVSAYTYFAWFAP